jgi:cytosine/adenosine deaminase-related metal-dependent hydrolase
MKKAKTILIKNADYVVTMNKKREILRRISVLIEGNQIVEVGTKRTKADRVINAFGMIVLPGFINCHHHMFQSLFRNVPYQQNQKIDKWIVAMCAMTREITEEASYYAAATNMIELLLSGCTTTTDFFYIFPKGRKGIFEATIKAAQDTGIRFHPYRGSMTLSKKDGALFDNDVVQSTEEILGHSEEMIKKYHDEGKFSMIKIGLGICAPFTNTREDFVAIVKLAKKYGANLQIHVGESEFENNYCLKKFGKRPIAFLHDIDWQGSKVSYVHCLYLKKEEIKILASSATKVVHCPISNARGESIAPITEMLVEEVDVGIGVDGSAGNDSSNILEEMRWARTLQGAREGFTYLKPSEVLEIGTIGGAKVLGRQDIGRIEVGKAADVAIFKTDDQISYAGAVCDPVGSLIASQAIPAEYVIVNGKIVVEKKELKTVDLNKIIQRQNKYARKMVTLAEQKTGKPLSKIIWQKAIKYD